MTMTLTPSTLRLDIKCGKSGISQGEKCHKGTATQKAVTAGSVGRAVGIGVAGVGVGIGAIAIIKAAMRPRGRQSFNSPGPSSPPPSSSALSAPRGPQPSGGPITPVRVRVEQPRITGSTPAGLLRAAPRPKSKTQRMRENTAAATRSAEQAIGRAAQAEITRAGAVANAMASAGEATGMTVKTTLRELRLRTEAARRRFEPGYRAAPAARRRAPAQLPEGGSAFAVPFNPATAQPPAREAAPLDPRTGQPRRRRARGFGRTDNYIPVYAPVALRGIR